MSAIRRGEKYAMGNDNGDNGVTPDVVDDNTVELDGYGEFNIFDDLKAALSADIEDKIESIVVPNRPNIYIRYNCTFEYDTLKSWMKSAVDRTSGKKKETDPKKLAKIVLHATCVGIEVQKGDKKIEWLKEGRSQTFDSPLIQEFLKASLGGWSQAIANMYASDGHMMQTMNRIITEAGYTEMDLDDVDGYDPLV
jgi:hypothetical protein